MSNLDRMNLFNTNTKGSEEKSTTNDGSSHTVDLTNLNLDNDILFSVMMQQKEFCIKVLSIILEKDIVDVKYNHVQNTIQNTPGYKSIRLDAFAEDVNGVLYNVEMQKLNNDNLPKRSRYYQGLIDASLLFSGKKVKYDDLKTSYIIFITGDDIFKQGLSKYTFTNMCHEIPGFELDNNTVKIFLNLDDNSYCSNPVLKTFLRYVKNTKSYVVENSNDLLKSLAKTVENLRRDRKVEDAYMRTDWAEERGKEIGREEGREEGFRIAEKISSLERISDIINDNLDDNFSDRKIKDKLIKRFNLTEIEACEYLDDYRSGALEKQIKELKSKR